LSAKLLVGAQKKYILTTTENRTDLILINTLHGAECEMSTLQKDSGAFYAPWWLP